MTTFEYTHKQIQICEAKAEHFKKVCDKSLTDFWGNAAVGYQRRLERMSLEEANISKGITNDNIYTN